MPAWLVETLLPMVMIVQQMRATIRKCEKEIERIARSKYPETEALMPFSGVRTLIAMTFVLTVEDPSRFSKSRDAGSYLGLRPKRRDSGKQQPELPITKEGDKERRTLSCN